MRAESRDTGSNLRKFSRTLIAALIFVLLGGYLYFFQIRKPGDEEKQRVFPAFNERQIVEIDLKYPSYTLVIRKDEDKWFVFEDTKRFKVDDKIISNMVKNISQMKIEKVVSEDAKDLAGFGLDSPEAEVHAKTREREYRILIGIESPTGSGTYVRVDDGSRIILVNENSVEGFLRKSANDLRDKRIVSLGKVNALEIESGNTSISITKKGNNWEVDGDKNTRVDESKLQGLLEGIEGLRVEKFVDDNPNNLTTYGLDKPRIQVTIFESDKKKTLLFGKQENRKVYAKLDDANSVYLVSDEILSKIPSSKDGVSNK